MIKNYIIMKKGITFGAFDLFHAGHVLMLEEAKTVCDYLIVCIQTDPSIDRKSKNTPVQSLIEREIQVTACKYVDEVLVYDTEADLLKILEETDWDVRILGDEYTKIKNLQEETNISINVILIKDLTLSPVQN